MCVYYIVHEYSTDSDIIMTYIFSLTEGHYFIDMLDIPHGIC